MHRTDIQLAELTLQGIKAIREFSVNVDSESILLPVFKKSLKILARLVKAEGASIYVWSRRGTVVKAFMYGEDVWFDENDFETAANSSPDGSGILVLPIPFKSHKTYLAQAVLGYITLSRKTPFSAVESETVRAMVDFLAHYIQYVWDLRFELKCQDVRHKLDRLLTENRKPGGVISYMLQSIHRTLQPRASYFGIVSEGRLVIEYLYYKSFVTVKRHQLRRLPAKLLSYAKRSNCFLWSDEHEMLLLQEVLEDYAPPARNGSNFLITSYYSGQDVIGLLIVDYDKKRYFDEEKVKAILAYKNGQIARSVGYLYQRRTAKVIANPIFHARDTRVNPQVVFVMMPFTEEWSNRIWTRMIKPTVEAEALRAIRADDLYGRDIMEDIWKGILSSRMVIADITGRNPNVFYELGIAHTIGKPVILLTQNIGDIPFDLNRYRHIIYADNMDGYDKLTRELSATIRELLLQTMADDDANIAS